MNWFEEWFDSPLYDSLYSNRNEEEAEKLASLIEKTIPPGVYPAVLDMGCGRGRHALTLAERGYRVKGIDLAEEAIEIAKEKAEERGISNVEFLVHDMRDPLPETYDSVVNLFTSFGYFDDDGENLRVFSSVKKMLRKGGILFMDYMNADWVRSHYEPSGGGTFKDIRYFIERYIEDDIIYKKIRFEGGGLDEPLSYTEQVKLYDLEWFLETFESCGFEIEQLFGDYHGAGFNPRTSSRLVMVVRKT